MINIEEFLTTNFLTNNLNNLNNNNNTELLTNNLEINFDNIGKVLTVTDGVAKIIGLNKVMLEKLVNFSKSLNSKVIFKKLALNLEKNTVSVLLMDQDIKKFNNLKI